MLQHAGVVAKSSECCGTRARQYADTHFCDKDDGRFGFNPSYRWDQMRPEHLLGRETVPWPPGCPWVSSLTCTYCTRGCSCSLNDCIVRYLRLALAMARLRSHIRDLCTLVACIVDTCYEPHADSTTLALGRPGHLLSGQGCWFRVTTHGDATAPAKCGDTMQLQT